MKSAVKYTKRNNRCRSGDMIADGLRVTGAKCQVDNGNNCEENQFYAP
jgi:hypothetical protein